MNNLIDTVQEESERFLREAGAEKYRMINVLDFMEFVSKEGVAERVNLREFNLEGTSFTQIYVELNGEYVYSTTIGSNAG
jgi:hypothetical protein